MAAEWKQQALELKRQENRRRIEADSDYRMVRGIANIFDNYYLDPILGFILPGIGDILTSICALPFIWVALVKVRSIPLTIAVISNTLYDILLGLIPFYIGDIIDVFNKSYKKNYRLIVGFVEGDKEIINQVNRKAIVSLIICALIIVGIYYLAKFTIGLVATTWDWISSLF
ncbi:MAG: DUF4112 domain-containing protein [Bacteroidales bacterium]|nr:DUF4112 domain-containing protein [Candidatus Sodaliphilus aphodohippi]